jgi:RNA polymerase sigma-70 factor (ECF subfamily)
VAIFRLANLTRMPTPQNFDHLMSRLRAGDQLAAEAVFERFGSRLAELAQSRLDARLRAKLDAEDVVQSVFRSFFTRQRAGQFQFDGWDGLWALLTVITLRKCGNQAAFYWAERRNLNREAPLELERETRFELAALDREPTPDEAAALADLVSQLVEPLDDRDRQVLALRMEGHSAAEISRIIGRAVRTVWRSLERIRGRLETLVPSACHPEPV